MVQCLATNCRVGLSSFFLTQLTQRISSLGQTIRTAYTLNFQTQLFAILPPSFVSGFKAYCASTLPPFDPEVPQKTLSGEIWDIFEILGLLDRYESVIASVGYEHIETYVLSTCTGKWETAMLPELRNWMSHKIVPWMLMMYARGAATSTPLVSFLFQYVTKVLLRRRRGSNAG